MTREAKNLDFAKRLLCARKKAGLTGLEVAERAGVTPQAYQQWEAGKTMPRGAQRQRIIADALGVTVNQLFFDEPDPPPLLHPIAIWGDEESLGDGYIFLPALKVNLSALTSIGTWHVDVNGRRQAFARQWAQRHRINPESTATMVVCGDGMEPRLRDGDSIIVDVCQNETIMDGKIYVIAHEGEVKVKRLFKRFGGLLIVSDNKSKPEHADIEVPADKMAFVKVIGLVVAVCGGV
jgi:transcriptional regulator with XRE-family HTH domain